MRYSLGLVRHQSTLMIDCSQEPWLRIRLDAVSQSETPLCFFEETKLNHNPIHRLYQAEKVSLSGATSNRKSELIRKNGLPDTNVTTGCILIIRINRTTGASQRWGSFCVTKSQSLRSTAIDVGFA
jgi:hypothetical protein